ncbi:MAG: DMT family protein [Paracoccaceae bacterium]
MPTLPVPFITIALLIGSNFFMTVAWYGHLKFTKTSLIAVILISWGIAFFEYLLQVPANRIGYGYFSAAQLKTIQEVITLVTFAIFSTVYLKEPLGWNHAVGFAFIFFGAWFIFHKWT